MLQTFLLLIYSLLFLWKLLKWYSAQLYKVSVKYWLTENFYSEFASTTEFGEHSWVLQLSKYLIIHTLSWILYPEESLESIPFEKLQVFLFFLNLTHFSHLLFLSFFPEIKNMSILSFICFQCVNNGVFPKIYIKLNLRGQTCKKLS